jgi:TolB-like protein/Tfp pilus assembly protein PilF
MVENARHPIRIDLNEFKLRMDLKNRIEMTLHFNSPSRRFYLAVIAFVVNEMKRLGKITSIPLAEHLDLLALLNESVGGSAGSSDKDNLLPRIYRKWQHALPNLEEAPLFKVLGKKKEYDEGIGKTYPFTEGEKDSWANLFEYKGSEENVRLKFAVDKIGVSLNDVVIIYADSLNADAWKRFISSLKGKVEDAPEMNPTEPASKEPEAPAPSARKWKIGWPSRYRWAALVAMILIIVGAVTLEIWKTYLEPAPVKVASVERMVFPLPDKPSIAVLPFVNMSDDPKQEFFSDGLTEEIITALSKSPYLFVIARNSTFTYKGKPVKVKQVAEELGVRYVLEGSVRRSGDQIRITAQLADAMKGHHLWAERYDRDLKDILALQDEIALKIMTTLHVKLQAGDHSGETGRVTRSVDAFLKTMEAREHILRYTREDNNLARKLLEEAITLDPDYARGYSTLAVSHAADVWLGTSAFPKKSLERAIELAKKALGLDESDATVHSQLAYLFTMTRQFNKAVSQAERALALDPNSYVVLQNSGLTLAFSGRPENAIPVLEKAIRIDPRSIAHPCMHLSMAYRMAGRYDDAVKQAKKAVEGDPRNFLAHISLAASYILAGREGEGRAAAAEALKLNPTFLLEQFVKIIPYKDESQVSSLIDALRKAGLK